MTLERQRPQAPRPPAHAGDDGPGESLERMRDEMESILDAADQALQSISPVDAEDYLARNRQRGGQ